MTALTYAQRTSASDRPVESDVLDRVPTPPAAIATSSGSVTRSRISTWDSE